MHKKMRKRYTGSIGSDGWSNCTKDKFISTVVMLHKYKKILKRYTGSISRFNPKYKHKWSNARAYTS